MGKNNEGWHVDLRGGEAGEGGAPRRGRGDSRAGAEVTNPAASAIWELLPALERLEVPPDKTISLQPTLTNIPRFRGGFVVLQH